MSPNVRSRLAWGVLAAALAVEVVGIALLLIRMAPTFPGEPDDAALIPLWASLFASLAIAWVWIGVTLVGALRSRARWVRSSAVTIHVLVFAAAIGVLQGILGTVPTGIAMMVLGVLGFAAAVIARPAGEEHSAEGASEDSDA